MTDKLPRLNYLTMFSSAIQTGISCKTATSTVQLMERDAEHTKLAKRCTKIWETLSKEDQDWIKEEMDKRPKGEYTILASIREVIELVYAEGVENEIPESTV